MIITVKAVVGCLVLCAIRLTDSHGFLKEPPSRSSMWCLGYDTPPNYEHNELNCGGWKHLVQLNGKCGVCGDSFDGVRQNEAGGKYANELITRVYAPGEIIPIVVNMTATHGGWFEFRLCANNDVKKAVTQRCLDENLLVKADNSGETRYTNVPFGGYQNPAYIEMLYRLPAGVTCQQCVLQWKYTAAQNPGYPIQEEFYGCADIAIASAQDPRPTVTLPKVSSITCSSPKVTTTTTYATTPKTPAPTTKTPAISSTKILIDTTTTQKTSFVTPPSPTPTPTPTPPPTIPREETPQTTTTKTVIMVSSTSRVSPTTLTTQSGSPSTKNTNTSVDTLTFDILYQRCKAKGALEKVFTETCRMLCSLPKSCLRTFCNTSCVLIEKYII